MRSNNGVKTIHCTLENYCSLIWSVSSQILRQNKIKVSFWQQESNLNTEPKQYRLLRDSSCPLSVKRKETKNTTIVPLWYFTQTKCKLRSQSSWVTAASLVREVCSSVCTNSSLRVCYQHTNGASNLCKHSSQMHIESISVCVKGALLKAPPAYKAQTFTHQTKPSS